MHKEPQQISLHVVRRRGLAAQRSVVSFTTRRKDSERMQLPFSLAQQTKEVQIRNCKEEDRTSFLRHTMSYSRQDESWFESFSSSRDASLTEEKSKLRQRFAGDLRRRAKAGSMYIGENSFLAGMEFANSNFVRWSSEIRISYTVRKVMSAVLY